MLKSEVFRSLSGNAVKVLLDLTRVYYGKECPAISMSLDDAKKKLRMGKSSAQNAFLELQELGFIVLGRLGRFQGRLASDWFLTFKDHKGRPQTNEWKRASPKKRRQKTKIQDFLTDTANLPEFIEAQKNKNTGP